MSHIKKYQKPNNAQEIYSPKTLKKNSTKTYLTGSKILKQTNL